MLNIKRDDPFAKARKIMLDESRRMQQTELSARLRPGEESQLRTEEVLREFLNQYETSLREQARESRVNRWISVVSLVIAAISMFIAIIK